jgi:hypothetical protein
MKRPRRQRQMARQRREAKRRQRGRAEEAAVSEQQLRAWYRDAVVGGLAAMVEDR